MIGFLLIVYLMLDQYQLVLQSCSQFRGYLAAPSDSIVKTQDSLWFERKTALSNINRSEECDNICHYSSRAKELLSERDDERKSSGESSR